MELRDYLSRIGNSFMNHGNIGKKNAAKNDEDKALSFIHARCKTEDKAAWVKQANAEGLKLTEWIIKKLNS